MHLTKRHIFNRAAAMGIGLALATVACDGMMGEANAFVNSPQIPLYLTGLRGASGPTGIPVAAYDGFPGPFTPAPVTNVKHYTININQFQDKITPVSTGLSTTTLWGYQPAVELTGQTKQRHLGGIIIGKGRDPQDNTDVNEPIQITFKNNLKVVKHIVPVDLTQEGAQADQGINRTAVHLHGGVVPWISDGGPFDSWQPNGSHGLSFLNNKALNPAAHPGEAEYYYPLNQSARFMWYHDHAHGITRLNAYAGLATALLVRDKFEASMIGAAPGMGLPDYIENTLDRPHELPLVFQDKIFVGADIAVQDPGWNTMVQFAATKPGSLWYAHTWDPLRWGPLQTGGATPLADPSIVPEFFGDTMLVNGTTYPTARVDARRYRLRMLNACNARFLNLQLYISDGSADGISLDPVTGHPTNAPYLNPAAGNTANWLQIGNESGFLSKPALVASNVPYDPTLGWNVAGTSLDPSLVAKSLLVAPAERTDLIVDFSGVTGIAGAPTRDIILYNDADAPFPSGDPLNDYFPGWNTVNNPVNAVTAHGNGPNTRILMRFRVKPNTIASSGPADAPLTITTATDFSGHIDTALAPFADIAAGTFVPPLGTPVRTLSLNEYFDEFGRLAQIIGNVDPSNTNSIFGTPYDGVSAYQAYGPGLTTAIVGATEDHVTAGTTEIWEVYNTTGDVHPMHIHLASAQLINREVFDPLSPLTAAPVLSGIPILPAANELGWKETFQMYPGTVTRFIVNFDLTKAAIVDSTLAPVSTAPGRYQINLGVPPASPRTGFAEYVWHCHILEHEEHDMMHALVVH